LLPMIFLLSFSMSMITQEVRKSTILVTPWWDQMSLLNISMSWYLGLGRYTYNFFIISREHWLFLRPSPSKSYYT
jgi:hypothetical protein